MALQRGLLPVAAALLAVGRADQVLLAEEHQQLLQLLLAQPRPALGIGRLQHALRLTQRPVAQQAHRRHAELEVAPAQGIGQRPLRRTIQRRRAR